YVYLNDENVFEVEFASSDELNLSLELDPLNRRTQFRFSLSDFAPERFRPLIEAFVPKISSYIGVNTRIDGSLSANLFSS
ncbi:hypothetical protein ACP3W2_27005, partial [Salmonella enterica]|uniref:hypothetical protein n=1 Tax=Salmonella enterica TaxID=28901 RepID=UPI003CF1A244